MNSEQLNLQKYPLHRGSGFPRVALVVTRFQCRRSIIPGLGPLLEEGHGYPLQYFTCRIPWTEGVWWLQSMWSQRFRYDQVTNTVTF